ncbi:hypothetical protein FSP39_008317 [Pinctada imbricata]|uniref:WH1 domain-containing protein n=1 Tax=Pinctada imbricata TaxID=66713 RepID=A0AA88YHY8_PINIB|nr:hypothetical protein FSP39_008317 [Pinctada imbricata]
MSEQRKPRSRNTPTILLDDAENQQLFSIIPKGSVSLAAGVVQLFLAEQPSPKKWNKRFCGVACFIKDNTRRSYYISVYDVENRTRVWEQELYQGFRYKTPREYFHTFETDKGQAALNFASEDEAFKFKETVEAKLAERHKRKIEKKRKTQTMTEGSQPPMSGRSLPPIPSNGSQANVQKEPMSRKSSTSSEKDTKISTKDSKKLKQKEKEKDKKKKKISKLDIGAPEDDFRIVSHVGWDPSKGFSMTELDPDMQALLQQVGITDSGNVDKATFDFIYDFVEQSGGIEQLKKEMREMPTLPSPVTPITSVKPNIPQAPPNQPFSQPSQGAPDSHGKRPPPPPARNNNTHLLIDQSTTLPPPVPSRPTSGVRRDLPQPPQPLAKPNQRAMPPPPATKPPSRMRSGGNTPPPPPAQYGSDFIDDLPASSTRTDGRHEPTSQKRSN